MFKNDILIIEDIKITKRIINFSEVVPENIIQDSIIEFKNKTKLLSIEKISWSSEEIVRFYFEKNKYIVKKCSDTQIIDISDEENKLLTEYIEEKYEQPLHSLITLGTPDFLIYKIENNLIKECFFAEIKSQNSPLNFSQATWMFSNIHVPYKLIFVTKNSFSLLILWQNLRK